MKSFMAVVIALSMLSVFAFAQPAGAPLGQPPGQPQSVQPPGVSFEQMAVTFDMVVVATVSEVGEEKSFDRQSAEPFGEAKVRSYTLAVTKVAQSAPAGHATNPKEKTPTDLTVWASDSWRMGGKFVPALEKDKSYVLFLVKMPKSKDYYMPPRKGYEAGDDMVKAAVDACNVDKWPWGKESGGLKMALLIPAIAEVPASGAQRPRGMPEPAIGVTCSLAVRNVSRKPIALNLYEPDHVLAASSADGAGNEVKNDLYQPRVGGPTTAPYKDRFAVLVAPGQIVFIGSRDLQTQWSMTLPGDRGARTIHVTYASKRDDKGPKGVKLWKGTLEAEAIPVTVKGKRYGPDEPLPP